MLPWTVVRLRNQLPRAPRWCCSGHISLCCGKRHNHSLSKCSILHVLRDSFNYENNITIQFYNYLTIIISPDQCNGSCRKERRSIFKVHCHRKASEVISTKQITMTFAFYAVHICIISIIWLDTFSYNLSDCIVLSEVFPQLARSELFET